MFITKMALPRRTFLRGIGATPGAAASRCHGAGADRDGQDGRRAVAAHRFHLSPDGNDLRPVDAGGGGAGFEMPRILAPLAPLRDQLLVVTGLCHNEGASKGDGSYPHPRRRRGVAERCPRRRRDDGRRGSEARARPRIRSPPRTSARTRCLPSLELALEKPSAFGCEGGTCLFSSTLSWKDADDAGADGVAPAHRFRAAVRRRRQRRAAARRPAGARASSTRSPRTPRACRSELGAGDRTELERVSRFGPRGRAAHPAAPKQQHRDESSSCPIARPASPTEWEEHAKLMFDLQVLAFQTDITRVFSLMMGARAERPRLQEPRQSGTAPHHLASPPRSRS